MDRVFGPAGYVDAFREVNPQPDQYTWWRIGVRPVRRTWVAHRLSRCASPLAGRAVAPSIYRDERFSDHALLTLDSSCEWRSASGHPHP